MGEVAVVVCLDHSDHEVVGFKIFGDRRGKLSPKLQLWIESRLQAAQGSS